MNSPSRAQGAIAPASRSAVRGAKDSSRRSPVIAVFPGRRAAGSAGGRVRRHTRESDRGRSAEDERHLVRMLKERGAEAVYDVRDLARLLYGIDGAPLPRHIRAARRWADRLQRLAYPLVDVDDEGRILAENELAGRRRSGRRRLFRFDPTGRWAQESLVDLERPVVADALIALEESIPPPVFLEQLAVLQETVRATLSLEEYRAAQARYDAAKAVHARHRQSVATRSSSCRP